MQECQSLSLLEQVSMDMFTVRQLMGDEFLHFKRLTLEAESVLAM